MEIKRPSWRLCDDFFFRAIFGSEDSAPQTKGILNAVMKQAGRPKIVELTIKNPIQLRKWKDEKEPILDIYAIDETGRKFDVEMQQRNELAFADRALFYVARMYGSQEMNGRDYSLLKPAVGVAFLGFPINYRKPDLWFDIWEMHSRLGTNEGTDKMANIFIRLPNGNAMEGVTTELNNWLKILTSYNDLSKEDLDVLSSSTNGVKELIGKMNTFVGSEDEFFARMAQEKYRNDREAREAIAEARLNEERQRYYEQTLWVLEQSLFARFHASMEPIRDLLLSKSGEELGKLTVQAIKCASFDEFVALL